MINDTLFYFVLSDMKNTEMESFLRRFHVSNDIDVVFTNGCCYWFSLIIYERFREDGAVVMYSTKSNHFGTKLSNGRVYDITGDVTDMYDWAPWELFDDELEKARIIRDCVMF